ncbi:hypothetical protein [Streptomonospora nanhaiensis]|uniref:hypothetical protein n=1 Tax=Streptomonospora nanhaiensis TaxID=1323731 RepID=UPI001C38257A|nr:hypothetical protein [Streptomonospora nanhaiensis]MBV2366953.1 hypothetical protein [Streptomonospora nanhaiensis]
MHPRNDPYVPLLGDNVTATRTDGTTVQGHLWRVLPELVRIITADDDMVTIPRGHLADMQELSYGVGDRIAVTAYDGRHEATITSVLPGAVGVRADDGRTATLDLPPAPGVTIAHLRSATAAEVDALMANRR